MDEKDIDRLVDEAERLGVIGSPSSTAELALDILGSAVTRKLVGELALFRFLQEGVSHYALGQITEVQLKNVWHEDPTMRSLIRQRGRIDAVSERQDTHLGKMVISAVFRKGGPGGYEPSILGTVPSTGTSINQVNDDVLGQLLSPYRDQIFYFGNVYGSKPKLPLWFKHYGRGRDGANEAYHLGIFGKTGSGKSVLARMAILAYSRYPQMAMLVIDPQGEFARDFHGGGPSHDEFSLPVRGVIDGFGKPKYVMTVRNLVLDRWELFEQILFESQFFERLTIPRGENRQLASSILCDRLRKSKVTLKNLFKRESFDEAWKLLGDEKVQRVFYRTDASRSRFNLALNEAEPDEFFEGYWSPVTELFREDRPNARTVEKALEWLLKPDVKSRPILVVDLSREQAHGMFWNERIQGLVIKRLLDGISNAAEYFYKGDKSLNALVVIDEAHRLAPRHISESDDVGKAVRAVLIDAARTTRKYGLGLNPAKDL